MNLPEFLEEMQHGAIRLKGHRIGLEHVVDLYKVGYPPEMINIQFPTLNLAQIHKVIAFYLENQAEVQTYVAQCKADLDAQRAASASGPTSEELKKRMELRKRLDAQQKAQTV